jgi:tripartite ATP-independent transporter DctM subunit
LHRIENGLLVGVFLAAISLPLLEAVGRTVGWSLEGNAVYLEHAVLWLSFLGGLLATRERKHLQLSTIDVLSEGPIRQGISIVTSGLAASITGLLAYAAAQVVRVDRLQGDVLTIGVPEWISELIMPVALVLIAARIVWQAGDRWWMRLITLAIVPLGFLLDFAPALVEDHVWAFAVAILGGAVLGAPVFVTMAGLAVLFYFEEGTPIAAVSAEIYRLISSPTLPAIPLLTVCGYLLAESKASLRLVRFFKAVFGWMPGGIAVLVAGVCAAFTTFTGGSGVTIIALGGLVYGILRDDNYPEGFSLGFVTASSSLGLLFPPSLPVILYAVVVSTSPDFSVPAEDLYVAGLLPGLLMIVMVAGWGMRKGRKVERSRPPFNVRELGAATWAAKWELSVPVIVIGLFVSGLASMVEAAAAAAFYALIVEVFITKDIHLTRDLPGVLVKAGVLVGAVLILLAAAMGLSSYVLVEAGLPDIMLDWVQLHIESKWVFLLALNGLLLLMGAVLEIYSAIVILPPLLAPMAAHYGVDPVHLGIIFLANLELGFITPPVGLNLFLAASRFEVPMVKLYRQMVPYVLILGAAVLLITYVPQMSVGVRDALRPAKVVNAASP